MSQTTDNFANTEIVTLPRHILAEQRKFPGSTGDLSMLLVAIQVGCKFVANAVRKAKLVNLTGLAAAGTQNVHAEAQKKLDVLANEIFINALEDSGKVNIMVSEENDEAFRVETARRGNYSVVFDPLDGSSNIECAVSIGTIFGVYHHETTDVEVNSVLRPGSEMVAAGYCVYGSSVVLVMATKNGVNGYTLDPSIGEFILSHPDIKIPSRGKIYSINEGNSKYWHEPVAKYIDHLKYPEDPKKAPYGARYVGSMVADVHRTLLYGGVFGYPNDKKSNKGKLRVLYECFPMAFVVEKAGGKATTGTKRVLDLVPTSIHDRSPIWLGSADDVAEVEEFYTKYPVEKI
ncbi:fructose-1,6-bisphosphatase [Gonapodya prolifera JEL478]|uniref:Fructose-1,6-bisphosphatase n=1 Tax=Gonapodya prolifera (strain JEL478) TaxID=1344416 RepID=A0A139AQ48_GONPJ|nr:fructose-1,6-bisphosphatase [Gonapodya prolifera JEL478]|eukprot:KXS18877.1 fructose-1,6-bisphosphatase [Gonapodya prolifera JEL478]